jgi:hypothetical protein
MAHATVLARKLALFHYIDQLEVSTWSDLFEHEDKRHNPPFQSLCGKDVCLVGNGPIALPRTGAWIDKHTCVVRCNEFSTKRGTHGRKIDIHIIQVACKKEAKQRSSVVINLEQTVLEPIAGAWTVRKDIWNCIQRLGDQTRGFLALLLLLKLGANLDVIGFGGRGHWNNPQHLIFHGMVQEHRVLESMRLQGRFSTKNDDPIYVGTATLPELEVSCTSVSSHCAQSVDQRTKASGKKWLRNVRKKRRRLFVIIFVI